MVRSCRKVWYFRILRAICEACSNCLKFQPNLFLSPQSSCMRHFFVVVCLSVCLNQVRKLYLHLFWNGFIYLLYVTDQKVWRRQGFMFDVSFSFLTIIKTKILIYSHLKLHANIIKTVLQYNLFIVCVKCSMWFGTLLSEANIL
jgi:hypothetical protein